jgi:hypothetical protein
VEEQDKIEAEDTEDADVEGHRVSVTRNAEPEGEDKARTASDESDDPDVEGHRHHGGV